MSEFWSDFRFWLEGLVTLAVIGVLIVAIGLLAAWNPWTLLASVPVGLIIVSAVIAASGALARRS